MSQYGNVVPNSIRRGTIKGTDIQNGTRYLSIVGCAPTLPVRTTVGRFDIRIFANNNRTPCVRCNEKGHPSYRCPQKGLKLCRICNESDHIARDCPSRQSPICYYCNEPGHVQRNCPVKDVEIYGGEYASEIRDGRRFDDDAHEPQNVTQPIAVVELIENVRESEENDQTNNQNMSVILGASNVRRMNIKDARVIDASISGATLFSVRQTLDKARSTLKEDANITKVVLSLGTNYVSQNKSDPEQVILNLTSAVNEVKQEFPVAQLGICGIIPRKGRSDRVKNFNSIAESVNRYAIKLCARDDLCTYIDTPAIFTRNGILAVEFYDSNDPSGLHINQSGAGKMLDKIMAYVHSSTSPFEAHLFNIPRNRKRFMSHSTPPSADKQVSKMSKSGSPDVPDQDHT
ncbi:hypothetical protein FSP39_023596 [Pinctada imbricata]|uniref:CCHC-type domain-containing protein n=1 Tax=Pinctada imbricata TaxID=66713 RepID=A0AA88XT78_PINIB|nr:hypothetical protein FSP39_023596 [Pinctada imbricata]